MCDNCLDEFQTYEVFSIEDWNELVSCGAISQHDGDGFFVVDGKETKESAFGHNNLATSVRFYSK